MLHSPRFLFLQRQTKVLTLGLAFAFALSLSVSNAATQYAPEPVEGRTEKKNPSLPIRDVIADVLARMEGQNTHGTRMESRFSQASKTPAPTPTSTPKSFMRSKVAVTTSKNDY